ncbi:MAG: hypothetical protein IKU63_03200 [Bacteroidaceae bacterium]|nr:hypothetical protein [Bacteroidaceae bacterium]
MQHPNKEHIQGKKENSCPNQKFEHSVRNLCFRKFEIPTPLFSLVNLFKKKRQEAITSNKTQRTTNNTLTDFPNKHLETLGAHLELHPREESRWLRTTQIQRTLPENPMSTPEKPKSIYHSLKAHFRTSKRGSHHPGSTKNNSKRLLQALHKGIKKLPHSQQISKPF